MPQRAEGVLHDTVDGRSVLVDPAGHNVISLNPIGSLVWSLLDGRDVHGLVDGVLAALEPSHVPREQVEQDVRAFLAELERLTLLAP